LPDLDDWDIGDVDDDFWDSLEDNFESEANEEELKEWIDSLNK
jgi:hypothetical protein